MKLRLAPFPVVLLLIVSQNIVYCDNDVSSGPSSHSEDASAFEAGPRTFDLGEPIPNRYIVVFNDDIQSTTQATTSLVNDVTANMITKLASAASSSATTGGRVTANSPFIISVLRKLGDDDNIQESATASDAIRRPRRRRMRAVVLNAPPQAVGHFKAVKSVQAVFPDRVVTSQAMCLQRNELTLGASATPATTFRWPGCITPGSKLVWRASDCGSGRIQYTEISALDTSNRLVIFRGKPCVITPTKPINANPWTAAQITQRFGRCGLAPTFARALPTTICGAISGSSGGTGSGAGGASTATEQPQNPNPTPVAVSSGAVLSRTAVKAGEQVPSGVARIQADASGVSDVSAAKQPVVVGVIDSGVTSNHPDINYAGGKTWATASTKVAGDKADAGVDLYGHGTHVAGIIGARNNGQGVIGVAPDVPIFDLKVLNGEGKGTLSDAMAAAQWAAGPEGQAKNIKVINLSLASFIDPTSPDYPTTLTTICRVFQEASDAGVFIAVSAGNYAKSLVGYIPASCPTVAVVTSIDPASNSPAPYSNWLPVDAPAADRARVIAAPGSNILSTLPYTKDPSGYRELSGTSMASPHIAGIAATCIMSGACPAASTCLEKLAVVQAAAKEKLGASPAYNAKSLTDGVKYYGQLAWAKF